MCSACYLSSDYIDLRKSIISRSIFHAYYGSRSHLQGYLPTTGMSTWNSMKRHIDNLANTYLIPLHKTSKGK